MREAGVLEDYLKKIKYDPAQKYRFSEDYVVHETITNYLDVSTPGSPLAACPYITLPFPAAFPAAGAIQDS